MCIAYLDSLFKLKQLKFSLQCACYMTKQSNTCFKSQREDVWLAEKVFCFSSMTAQISRTIICKCVKLPQDLCSDANWPFISNALDNQETL